ncbi:ATM interactor [Bagarius yarrelli]|uniref:ATM interactor n=1 Tax=Bagarius yarrelli TaxID=175774 RepID=A0A556V8S5_BAGYA|nr:ATM interactor [Bagarius yarrelli]
MAATAAGEPGCSGTNRSEEIIKPSIIELTKVRTNILCTVKGCGKILPNTPALNMHLVKSHRVKDGIVNPTVRKDIKGSQKLYCCPIEGCPRGPNRPFSQFALVKQHFMKMHAEKKHKCVKCSNGYSTEWDLKRHAEDCGRTYSCTCGCPYASRTALLSHIYRTGHEVPKEHRYPPVKKRKMEKLSRSATKLEPNGQTYEMEATDGVVASEGASHMSSLPQHNPVNLQKLLLPMPKVALVNVPVMQLAHLPVLLPQSDNGALRPMVLAVDTQASVSTLHLMPQSLGSVMPSLNPKGFKETMSVTRSNLDAVSTGIQVNLESLVSIDEQVNNWVSRSKSTSTNIQTDISFLSKGPTCGVNIVPASDGLVSSGSQTDISVSAQILLPVSVQTQTFPLRSKATSSIGAQTESLNQITFLSGNTTKETQTSCSTSSLVNKAQMDQAIMCANLFDSDMLNVSTQTTLHGGPFGTNDLDSISTESGFFDDKTGSSLCFGAQRDLLNQNTVADNQTQTMNLFSDLENILSDSMASGAQSCGSGLVSVQEQPTGIDFDIEDFLNAAHIQTQTEESALGGLSSETPLEFLDIETQTDFLLFENLGDGHHSEVSTRVQTNDLELEMFDTQTQTDLNFLLDPSSHMSLSSILRHSSFNMSTESLDTETQTDTRAPPTLLPLPLPCSSDGQIRLSSTETQTVSSSSSLGQLFLTSNETQTVMDDFLSADLAWNVVSHLSSVETQTGEDLLTFFQHSDKANS